MTWNFIHFPEIDSTSLEACRRVENGASKVGDVIYADTQTKAYGRRGRTWQSSKGNLLATVIIDKPEHLSQISFVFGLALFDAINEIADETQVIKLKWPNDLLMNEGKLAGVLPEIIDDHLIIGFGVNLVVAPQSDQPVATLQLPKEPLDVLKAVLRRFDVYRALWQKQGFAPIRKIWLENVNGVGKAITARFPNGEEKSGIFKDINSDGALILGLNDNEEIISTADIFFGS